MPDLLVGGRWRRLSSLGRGREGRGDLVWVKVMRGMWNCQSCFASELMTLLVVRMPCGTLLEMLTLTPLDLLQQSLIDTASWGVMNHQGNGIKPGWCLNTTTATITRYSVIHPPTTKPIKYHISRSTMFSLRPSHASLPIHSRLYNGVYDHIYTPPPVPQHQNTTKPVYPNTSE